MTVTGVRWEESTNRKKNQGIVTIVDKTAYKSEKFMNNQDFLQTNRGGGIN